MQIGARAGFDSGEAGIVAVIPAQEHKPRVRKRVAHRQRGVVSRAVIEVEIHDHHIRRKVPRQRTSLSNGSGLADHLHVLLPVKQQTQAFGDELVVFDDDDADRSAIAVHAHDRRWPSCLELTHRLRRARPAWSDSGPRAAGRAPRPAVARRCGPGEAVRGTCPATRRSLRECQSRARRDRKMAKGPGPPSGPWPLARSLPPGVSTPNCCVPQPYRLQNSPRSATLGAKIADRIQPDVVPSGKEARSCGKRGVI